MKLVKRVSFAFAAMVALAACGGDDDGSTPPDAAPLANEGFVAPDHATTANENGAEIGPANWACLGTPGTDTPTTVEIALSGVINQFDDQTKEVSGVTVSVFDTTHYDTPLDTTTAPTDLSGTYSLTLPAGHTRFGFKVSGGDIMDTFLLNQDFEPATAAQTLDISVITNGIAQALPALVSIVRVAGTGVLAGAMRDCDGHEVAYAVATVSATSGAPDHLEGADSYYLDSSVGLPVQHDQLLHTDTIGLFAVFQLPPTTTAYIQVWGFVDAADLADGEMTLLAELPSPVVADTVITGSIEPLRQ